METKIDVYSLAGDVMRILNNVASELAPKGASNGEWTRKCLQKLARYGREKFRGVCPWPDNMKGEWLYDLIWYTETDEDVLPKRMKAVVLTLESEWSHDIWDIRYDFQKLIQAKSLLKVLVCEELSDESMRSLCADIDVFDEKNDSEVYMFASYSIGEKKFNCSTYRRGHKLEKLD